MMPFKPSAGAHTNLLNCQADLGRSSAATLEYADAIAFLRQAQRRDAATKAGADDQPIEIEIGVWRSGRSLHARGRAVITSAAERPSA